MSAPAVLKQADLERVMRAAAKSPMPVHEIRIAPDGTIRVIYSSANDDEGSGTGWEDAC